MLADLGSLRLRMTAVSAGDIDLMRALNADEAVMRNLTGVSATAQQTEAEWTQRLQERSDPGRGTWLPCARERFVVRPGE